MAAPIKQGLDYFPLDTVFDDKIEIVYAIYKTKYPQGSMFTVTGAIIEILKKIYFEGYFKKWDEDISLIFSSKNSIDYSEFKTILDTAIDRGIFDKTLYEKYHILTSKGIQKRYFKGCERRAKVDVIKEYLLIDVSEFKVNVDINSINVDINSKNVCNNQQSKVKESKVNKNKVNSVTPDKPVKHKYGKYNNVLLTDDEVKKLEEKFPDFQSRLDYFSNRIEMKGYKYKSHYLAFLEWNREENKKNTTSFSIEKIKAKVNNFD